MAQDEKFDPAKMQSIVDKLKAEGRMPTPEKLRSAMVDARGKYQEAVRKARIEDRQKAKKKSSKSNS